MIFLGITTVLLAGLSVLGVASLSITGPSALYPQVLIGSAFILLLICSGQHLRGHEVDQPDDELDALSAGSTPAKLRFALFCGIWLAYPLLLRPLGFTATTALTLYVSVLLFGVKRPLIAFLGTLGFAIVFAMLLKSVIYVPVPEAWADRLINSLMYRF